jgi:hypothetical protein
LIHGKQIPAPTESAADWEPQSVSPLWAKAYFAAAGTETRFYRLPIQGIVATPTELYLKIELELKLIAVRANRNLHSMIRVNLTNATCNK